MTGTTANPDRWGCPCSLEVNLSVLQPCVCVCGCVSVRVCVCVWSAGAGVMWMEEPQDTPDGGLEGACVSVAGVPVPCRWPFFPLPSSFFL